MTATGEQKPKAGQVVHFSCDLPIPLAPYCRPMLMGDVQTTTHRRDVTCQACLQKLRSWRPQAVALVLLVFLAGLLGSGVVFAEHRPEVAWMAGYRDALGHGCCGEQDCLPWPVAVVALPVGDEMPVRIGDTLVMVSARAVHASQTEQTYWCCKTDLEGQCPAVPTKETTRCVFFGVGF